MPDRTIKTLAARRRRRRLASDDGNRLEQTEIRCFHAMMLIDRAPHQGIAKRRKRCSERRWRANMQIGMPRHIEMTKSSCAE
jgi:hypothetical protein